MIRRRAALKNIGIIFGSLTFLPYACSHEQQILYPNITPYLKSKQFELFRLISDLILPKDDLAFPTNESRQKFILTMINDCYSESNIKKLITSFQSFESKIIKSHNKSFFDLSFEQQMSFLNNEYQSKSDSLFFLDTLKNYSIRHLETSENYMSDYLYFEFIPGRYEGKVLI